MHKCVRIKQAVGVTQPGYSRMSSVTPVAYFRRKECPMYLYRETHGVYFCKCTYSLSEKKYQNNIRCPIERKVYPENI